MIEIGNTMIEINDIFVKIAYFSLLRSCFDNLKEYYEKIKTIKIVTDRGTLINKEKADEILISSGFVKEEINDDINNYTLIYRDSFKK